MAEAVSKCASSSSAQRPATPAMAAPTSKPMVNSDSIDDFEEFGGDGINYAYLFETNQFFRTRDEAFDWALGIALANRFDLVKASNGRKNRTSSLRGSYFRCSRRGKFKGKVDPDKLKGRSTKKHGCQFRIRAVEVNVIVDGKADILWQIVTFPKKGYHNHGPIEYSDGHLQHVGLDKEEKQYISEQTDALVGPKEIHHGLHKISPDKARPKLRAVQNQTSKIRRKKRRGRNAAQQMMALITEHKYVSWHEKNSETGELTHIFMSHPESVKLFRAFPHVILLDSTYKTNLYKMALVEIVGVTPVGSSFLIGLALIPSESKEGYKWLLEKLSLLLENSGQTPSTIITDRELGLIGAIPSVFPSSSHLICWWHLNRAVEAKSLNIYGSKYLSDRVLKSKETGWYKVVHAVNEESYHLAWKAFSDKWPALAAYVVETWGTYTRSFVKCYTNGVFHLGNTATSRVESAHALLKSWIKSSKLKIDTMWSRIHAMLESQHSKIRSELEHCRSKTRHTFEGPLFELLPCKVTNRAIELLEGEFLRGCKLGIGVDAGCGCKMPVTHGLPCACELVRLKTNGHSVHVDIIHPFWKTLSYDNKAVVPHKDSDILDGLLEEVRNTDSAHTPMIIEKLREVLHPEDGDVKEPLVRENPKGRPRKSTTRNKSGFEHARKRAKTCRTSASTNVKAVVEIVNFPPAVDGAPLEVNYTKGPISAFEGRYFIPEVLWEFFDGWVNVKGDGHCGFRVLSHAARGSQDHWALMREWCVQEMESYPVYKDYWSEDVEKNGRTMFDNAKRRVTFKGKTGCYAPHWMHGSDLFAFASFFNWTICTIGSNSLYKARVHDPKQRWDCRTYLPLRSSNSGDNPRGVVWILNDGSHWMRLHPVVPSNDVPMPPIAEPWYGYKDSGVTHFDELYKSNIANWHSVMGTTPKQRRRRGEPVVRNLFADDPMVVVVD